MKIFGKEFKTKKQLRKELAEFKQATCEVLGYDHCAVKIERISAVHTIDSRDSKEEDEIAHKLCSLLAEQLMPYVRFRRKTYVDIDNTYDVLVGELKVVKQK